MFGRCFVITRNVSMYRLLFVNRLASVKLYGRICRCRGGCASQREKKGGKKKLCEQCSFVLPDLRLPTIPGDTRVLSRLISVGKIVNSKLDRLRTGLNGPHAWAARNDLHKTIKNVFSDTLFSNGANNFFFYRIKRNRYLYAYQRRAAKRVKMLLCRCAQRAAKGLCWERNSSERRSETRPSSSAVFWRKILRRFSGKIL